MNFDPGFEIRPTVQPMGFAYGEGVFGPQVEVRHLDAIRKSLRDPQCEGPDEVYAIVVGNEVEGVAQEVVDNADTVLEIPQFGTKHSLNVAVSAGLALWHFLQSLHLRP